MILLALAARACALHDLDQFTPAPGGRTWLTLLPMIPLAHRWHLGPAGEDLSSTRCSALFASIYLLPFSVVVLNSFRDLARHQPQRPDRSAAQLFARLLVVRPGINSALAALAKG